MYYNWLGLQKYGTFMMHNYIDQLDYTNIMNTLDMIMHFFCLSLLAQKSSEFSSREFRIVILEKP